MTARNEIFDALGLAGWPLSDARDVLKEFERDATSKLAEKIRQDPTCPLPAHREYFALLIDPKSDVE